MLADVFIPSATAAERQEFVAFQRQSGPAELAARWLQCVFEFDLRELPGQIRCPTLVVHRTGDRAIPFELGRDLAARIPEARFVALDGADHIPWFGDAAAVARAVLEFAGVEDPEVEISSPAEEPPVPLPRTSPTGSSRSSVWSPPGSATLRSPSSWCSARTPSIGTSPTSARSCAFPLALRRPPTPHASA